MTDIDVTILPNPERFDGYPCPLIKAGPATVTVQKSDSEDEFYVKQGDDYGFVHKDFVVFSSEPWKPNNPIEFDTIAVTDGIAMGSDGMRASLASRETIADSIELAVTGHCLDAMVLLVGCDKTIPAAAMAWARLDVPTVIL